MDLISTLSDQCSKHRSKAGGVDELDSANMHLPALFIAVQQGRTDAVEKVVINSTSLVLWCKVSTAFLQSALRESMQLLYVCKHSPIQPQALPPEHSSIDAVAGDELLVGGAG